MIVRIVKLTFEPDNIQAFLALFEAQKQYIATFEGCLKLELLNDINNSNIFFTYSIWENEHYLNAYRNSAYFEKIWKATKALFSQKAEAWTTKVFSA